jgi:hypothetical protein
MFWNLSQDQFNKLFTILLTVIVTCIFVYGLVTGKQVNLEYYLSFLIPTINHITHQIVSGSVASSNIQAEAQKTVAQIQQNGGTH